MARRSRNSVLSIPAALEALGKFLRTIDPALAEAGGVCVDYEVVFTYVMPGGQRQEVTRECLTGKVEEGGTEWPLPGQYEIDVFDSEGSSLLQLDGGGPWVATHFDKDALVQMQKDKSDVQGSTAALIQTLQEESRIAIRQSRFDAEQTRGRESKLREELNVKQDVIGDLQRKMNAAIARADKSDAERELAEKRLKEAKDELDELEDRIASLKPHISMGVDMLVDRVGSFLGLPPANSDQPPAEDGTPSEGNDPPPPDAGDPAECLHSFLDKVLYDPAVMRPLVEQGAISWPEVRAMIWHHRKIDIGPTPDWGDGTPSEQSSSDPPQGDEKVA